MREKASVLKEVFRMPVGWIYGLRTAAVIALAIPPWNQFLRDPKMEPSSRVQNLLICVVAAAVFLRASRMRLEASDDGITVFRMRPAEHIAWADATSITIKPNRIQGAAEGFNHHVAIGRHSGKDVSVPALSPDWGGGRWGPDAPGPAVERLATLIAEHQGPA